MTPTQFDALAKLLALRQGPSREAARLHFVGGLKPADAGRAAGITTEAACACIRRCKAGIELAQQVVGPV
jgi:DNA-directed RNA polymerase specialized sigma24 family protein